MVNKPVFPVFGAAPNPADPSTFDARAADMLGKLPAFAAALNKYPAYVDANSRALMRNLQEWTGGITYDYDDPTKYTNYWMRFSFSKPEAHRRSVFVARFNGDPNSNQSFEMKLQLNAHFTGGARYSSSVLAQMVSGNRGFNLFFDWDNFHIYMRRKGNWGSGMHVILEENSTADVVTMQNLRHDEVPFSEADVTALAATTDGDVAASTYSVRKGY